MNSISILTFVIAISTEALLSNGAIHNNKMWQRQYNSPQFFHFRDTNSAISEDTVPVAPTEEVFQCTQAGFFPSNSCQDFYRCVDWYGDGSQFSIFHFTCPKGSAWDIGLDTCNYASAVSRMDCRSTQIPIVQPDNSGPNVLGPDSTVPETTNPESSGKEVDPEVSPIDQVVPEGDIDSSETEIDDVDNSIEDEEDADDSDEQEEGDNEIVLVMNSTSSPSSVFTITCYNDTKYRTHPLYCNRYYYCVFDVIWNVPFFTCPESLVFDEVSQTCAKEAEGVSPDCPKAPYDTETPEENPDSSSGTQETTITEIQVHPESLYDCPSLGYFPFEGDCVRFYKCVKTDNDQVIGLLYRCPDNFGYSEERERCLKKEDLPVCERVTQPAHLRDASEAVVLRLQDLLWFFNN